MHPVSVITCLVGILIWLGGRIYQQVSRYMAGPGDMRIWIVILV